MSATPDSTLTDPKDHLIADLQRRLAECAAERDEALAQQTATAEVLQVINSSPGNLAPVFDAMLERAMRLCEADHGHVLTFDGQRFHPAAIRGEAGFVEWRRRRGPVRPDSGADASPLGRVMQGERVAQVADATQEKSYRTHSAYKELVDISGIRSSAAVALRKEDVLLGTIVVYRREVRPFSDQQIALLQNFAAQAVIAMENARLLTETREALERQTATAEILRVISASPNDLQPTLDAIAASATILSGAANGAVSRFDGSLIHFAAHYGWTTEEVEAVQKDFPSSPSLQSTTGRAILKGEVVHVPDITADTEYGLRSVFQTRMRTGLSVPILQDGNPVGAITVTRREVAPFSQAQIDLLKTFADQAVIAIENVRLFDETREALEQQTATAEVLGVINSSPGDLAPVFDAVVEKAMRLSEATNGYLFTYDGDRRGPRGHQLLAR